MQYSRKFFCLIAAAWGLSACAETQLAIHTAKQIAPGSSEEIKKTPGIYKIGTPYEVQGVWYYPNVDYEYRETGIASWYGDEFHGRPTANGETFDMNEISAAHRTLPLPSVVRVVNLHNGRALTVRVNDRGPFARNRIIDLSRRAAQLLGFERQGTVPVRVEILADESRQVAALAQRGAVTQVAAVPSRDVDVVPLDGTAADPSRASSLQPPSKARPSPEAAPPQPQLTYVPVSGTERIYVQAGAFVRRELAERMRSKLSAVGPTRVVEALVGNQRFFRVRVGPAGTVEGGDRLLDHVIAYGYPEARIVVDD